jgi:hypothetical protein
MVREFDLFLPWQVFRAEKREAHLPPQRKQKRNQTY